MSEEYRSNAGSSSLPNVLVIAGPNGAGKSTAAPRLIGKRLGIAEFVNADVNAAGLANFFSLYSPIADSWEMHDNASPPARLIAAREGSGPIRFGDQVLWETIQDPMKVKEKESQYGAGPEPRLMGVPISEVMDIFTLAGREALARHKALGLPVVIWRDGKVVEIPPEEIEI